MRDTVNNSLPQVMPIIALLNSHSAAQLKLTLTPEQAQYLVGEFQRLNAKLRRPHLADGGERDMTQITNKMAQEWQTLLGQAVSVKLIAARYGVNPDTVYRHTNPHLADRRREQWRNAKRLAAQRQGKQYG